MRAKPFSFDEGVTERKPRERKPAAPGTVAKWPPDPPKPVDDDELMNTAVQAVITLMNSDIDAKDMNAAIANAVRLIQVRDKIKPDDDGPEDYFGNEQ
jgi:hypothetical protein